MRFSNYLLAAATTALVVAAPVAQQQQQDDECVFDPEPESSSVAPFSSSVAVASSIAAVASSTVASLSSSAAKSSSVAAVASSTAASSAAAVTSTKAALQSSSVASSAASSSVAYSSAATSAAGGYSAPSSSAAASSVATSAVSSSSAAYTSVVASSTSGTTSGTTSSSAASATGTGFQWFGVNESGAEFGATNIPGTLGTDYTWPNTSAIDIMMDAGMNIFRIPILMERLVPTEMTGTIDATYLSGLQTVVNHITEAGAHAVIDSQNFGRYAGSIFTSTSDFKTYWTTVSTEFADNEKVIFDCNNEFHDEPSISTVVDLNQACIDGIRAAGATSQYIFVEGTSYTGAWTWTTSGNSDAMGNLTDTENKIIYEMHQYLDSDGSGTSETCVSETIGAERIASATTWLRENGKLGIIGEYAGGANSVCEAAVTGMLASLAENNDVWTGAMWWGGGPWWGDYIFSMEPSTGTAYESYLSVIKKYA
jgi:endoglucanase